MRFLLHATKPRTGTSLSKGAATKVRSGAAAAAKSRQTIGSVQNDTTRVALTQSANTNTTKPTANPQSTTTSTDVANLQRTWGQQCSPNCGCVVRFETTVDSATNTIVSSTYHARTVLTTTNADGTLSPRLTQRATTAGSTSKNSSSPGGRPMLTECNCPTVHTLSSRITTYLPEKTMEQIFNSTEYASVRSSPSFRRTVLVENGLSRKGAKCFDLVEEAFLASVRGHMPRPRRVELEFGKEYEERIGKRRIAASDKTDEHDAGSMEDDDEAYGPTRGLDLNPSRYADAARKAGKVFPPIYESKDEASVKNNAIGSRSTIGAASSSSGDGAMPAFHLASDYNAHQNAGGLVGRYDDELDELCREIGGIQLEVNDEDGETADAATREDKVLSDWLAYVDELYKAEQAGGRGGGRQESA